MKLFYKKYENCEDKQKIRQIYNQAFPKPERFPFWVLEDCSKNDNVCLEAILYNEQIIGMWFIVSYDNISYLMYFAMDENYRGKGYGSKALKELVAKNNNILLCIEEPIDDTTKRRKSFYIKNGFFETGCHILDAGIKYEVLSSIEGFIANESILRKRYTEMSSNPITRHIIKHTFDVEKVNILKKNC